MIVNELLLCVWRYASAIAVLPVTVLYTYCSFFKAVWPVRSSAVCKGERKKNPPTFKAHTVHLVPRKACKFSARLMQKETPNDKG